MTNATFPDQWTGGTRYDSTCDLDPQQRKVWGYICYSDVTFQYDIWWWFFFSSFIFLLVWSIHCLYIMMRIKENEQLTRKRGFCSYLSPRRFFKKLNPASIVVLITICTCIERILWLSTIYNGRVPAAYLLGTAVNSLLINFGQYLIISNLFVMSLVWGTLVNSAKSLQVVNVNDQRRNYLKVVVCVSLMLLVVLPVNAYGTLYSNQAALNVANYISVLVTQLLTFAGALYSCRLHKLLMAIKGRNAIAPSSNIESDGNRFTSQMSSIGPRGPLSTASEEKKRKPPTPLSILALRNTQVNIVILLFCGCMDFSVVVVNTFTSAFVTPAFKVWLWWFPLALAELLAATALVNMASFTARHRSSQEAKLSKVEMQAKKSKTQAESMLPATLSLLTFPTKGHKIKTTAILPEDTMCILPGDISS